MKWTGSEDPADKSGTATFVDYEQGTIEVRFESFVEYMKISKALDSAYKNGKRDAIMKVCREISATLLKLENAK